MILLSTFNGARFLPEQLASFESQTYKDWHLLWRDDGSKDETLAIMEAFSVRTDRCTRLVEPTTHLGPTDSFLLLLKESERHIGKCDIVMFADQDDIWLPTKMEAAKKYLNELYDAPTLYFSKTRLIDSNKKFIADSQEPKFIPKFPDALAQNIAPGCTMALNYFSVVEVNGFDAPRNTHHDWWCYIIVAFLRGVIVYDKSIRILYRQHSSNTVGYERVFFRRAARIIQRGAPVFTNTFRDHISHLYGNKRHRKQNFLIVKEFNESMQSRFGILRLSIAYKIKRQRLIETLVFYALFLFW